MVWSRELNAKAAEICARENLESHATAAGTSLGAGWSRELNAKGARMIEQEGPHAEAEHTTSAATHWLISWCRSLSSSSKALAATSTGGLAEECRGAAAVCEPGASWSRGLNGEGMNLLNESRLMQHYDEATMIPAGATWSRELNARAAEVASPVMQHYDALTNSPPGTTWSRDLNAKALETIKAVEAESTSSCGGRMGTWSRDLNRKGMEMDAATSVSAGTWWSKDLNSKAMEAQFCASFEKHCDAITAAQTVTWSKDLNKKAADSEAAWSLQKHYDAITEAAAGAAWSGEMNLQAVEAWDKQELHDSRPLRRKPTLEPKPHGRERQSSDVSTAAPMSRQGTERTDRALSWDDDFDDDWSHEPRPLEERCAQILEGAPELEGAQE